MLLLFYERVPMSGPPYKCAKGMGMGALLSAFAFNHEEERSCMLTVAQCLQSDTLAVLTTNSPCSL